jgi:hypothetical protein
MKESRNPFLLRASEQTESDDTFVRWFSPRVLEILEDSQESLWNKLRIFRSAPGGGKTSLMRLFTPNSLLTLCRLGDRSSNSRELFQRLKQLGVVDETGPKLLGIFLDCARGNLENLDQLDIEPAKQNRLLLSLLNARIVLAALRGALELKGLRYPEASALEQLEILSSPDISSISIQLPCSGKSLYDWAYDIERNICDALDSLITPKDASLPGHDSLIALNIIRPEHIIHNGQPVAERVVLMLDNFHRLTEKQRRFLLQEVVESRVPIGIWIAERLVALDVDELLSDGAILGRDHDGIINLETFWQRDSRRFEKLVKNIADYRVIETANRKIESFDLCIQNSLETDKWQTKFIEGTQVVAERIRARVTRKHDYDEWIRVTEIESSNSNPQESAISWRTLEILIERQERKPRQLTLFDSPIEVDELERRNSSSVREAAELFFCQEFNIPYYYGISRLATMASSNIEQFLWLAGNLFEESLSAAFLKQRIEIPPDRQQQILKRSVEERWNSMPQDVQYGRDVRNFLEAIGEFSKLQTNRPNAPYVPGITGIAITMSDRNKLQDAKQLDKDPGLAKLSRVIKTCVANNLLHAALDRKQGQKGEERKMLLYLNRMLCIHFDLPLGYGGWNKQSLPELVTWLNFGFKPPKQLELSL